MKFRTATTITALAAAAMLTLAGCAGTTTAAETSTAAPEADSLTIQDAWVKAADSGMSAAFGTLENASDTDLVVTGVESAASTTMQLHETVENESGAMVMREKDGGFTIPAGGSFELAPGGNHLMLMDLTAPITAGTDVDFTLTLEDGSTYEFTAPAKDYTGANENYEGGDMDMDMGTGTPTDSMDMGN
ncbi:MAG: copper chaperone PCu(A)C [Herbiconiux sp.]|uniref:copper chaperone PCu(A)C n=1 Tax=Herbiconiux sp. TaxID=1871186 RepID=UPI0011FF20CF|nr:copper chaperone PCu(A)C [Herbiconiux sp.]TAJ47846.1 MAG: copper chaperone PCu(A)C [Herbiconiux sp.]